MAIGGSVDDGPFQDIVALDFPQGDQWYFMISGFLALFNLHTFTLYFLGDQSTTYDGTTLDVYDTSLVYADCSRDTAFYSPATSQTTNCSDVVSTPNGWTFVQWEITDAGASGNQPVTHWNIKTSGVVTLSGTTEQPHCSTAGAQLNYRRSDWEY